ncbi:putative metalloendoproteinase 1-like [Capsicum annuum]|nr:putative metalloendoproteinase 1-like [Capsicum annuum]
MAGNSTPGTSTTDATPNTFVPIVLPYAKSFFDVSNIEIFANENFKRWQERIFSPLDVHGVAYALSQTQPDANVNNKILESCCQEAKVIWEALIKKFTAEDVTKQKFVVEKFYNWQMRDDTKVVYLGDSRTAKVLCKGKVLLKLISEKTLVLMDVLHVPTMRANLILVALLDKDRMKVLSRYTHNLNNEHWSTLMPLVKYLKGTMNYDILYSRFPSTLEGYCDVNWIFDSNETKFTSGYMFTLGGGAVSWKSAKQTIIARSTMKSEFVALKLASTETE